MTQLIMFKIMFSLENIVESSQWGMVIKSHLHVNNQLQYHLCKPGQETLLCLSFSICTLGNISPPHGAGGQFRFKHRQCHVDLHPVTLEGLPACLHGE